LKRLRRINVSEVVSGAGSEDATAPPHAPTVSPTDDLRRVATLFLEQGVDILRCVDADGHVVGIVTRDAVAARLAAPAGAPGATPQ
jgi:CBS domain-containing protein